MTGRSASGNRSRMERRGASRRTPPVDRPASRSVVDTPAAKVGYRARLQRQAQAEVAVRNPAGLLDLAVGVGAELLH